MTLLNLCDICLQLLNLLALGASLHLLEEILAVELAPLLNE